MVHGSGFLPPVPTEVTTGNRLQLVKVQSDVVGEALPGSSALGHVGAFGAGDGEKEKSVSLVVSMAIVSTCKVTPTALLVGSMSSVVP